MDFFRFEDAALGELLAAAKDRSDSTAATTQPTKPTIKDSSPSEVPTETKRQGTPHPTKSRWCCVPCGKTFTRGFALRAHLRTHDNSKPFACTVCNTTFTRDHDRKMHENLHFGAKDFVCGDKHFGEPKGCGRSFSRASNLKRHLATCKGEPWVKSVASKSPRRSDIRRRRSVSPGSTALNPIAIQDIEEAAEGSEGTLQTSQGQSRSHDSMITANSHAPAVPSLPQLRFSSPAQTDPPTSFPSRTSSPPAARSEDSPETLAAKLTALEDKLKLYERFWREKGFDVRAEAEAERQDRDNLSFTPDVTLGSRRNRHSDASSTSSVTRMNSSSQTSDSSLSKTTSNTSTETSMLMDGRSKVERIFRSNSNNPLVRSISNQGQEPSISHGCPLCHQQCSSMPHLRNHLFTHVNPSFRRDRQDSPFHRVHQHDSPWVQDWMMGSGEEIVYCLANPGFGSGAHWGCGQKFKGLEALRQHFVSEQGRRCIQPVFDGELRTLLTYENLDLRVLQVLTRTEAPLLPLTFLKHCSELSEGSALDSWGLLAICRGDD